MRYQGRFFFYSTSNATGSTFVQLSPLVMDARLLQVSDAFQEFRFTRVVVRSWLGNVTPASPSVTPGGANVALGYFPALITNTPVTHQEILTAQNAAIGNGTFGSPYPRIKMNRNDLLGAAPVKWYRRGSAYDDTLEVQGIVYALSNDLFSARPIMVLVEYECEFRIPADPALTATGRVDPPDPVAMQNEIAELQRVLGITKILVRRPPPLDMDASAGEVKESDEYVRINEPAELPMVAPPPPKASVVRQNWASVPTTPASGRRP